MSGDKCGICGNRAAVCVDEADAGTYWLCGVCAGERIEELVALRKQLEAAERDKERYRRKHGSPVFVNLTWPTGATEVTTLEALAAELPDYLDGFEPNEEWGFEIVEMTQEEYDNLPEFMGP